jgi:galactokinase
LAAVTAFRETFGGEPERVVRAPGRVNLIGEHTDYNEGFVLPMAIDRAVVIAAHRRSDRRVLLHALDFGQESAFDLDDIAHDPAYPWSNYVRGVAFILQGRGIELPGMEAVIAGDVPIGAGLSSSAAIEVATAVVWRALGGFDLDGVTLALLCQQAENEFVGMRCGIMDQFIATLGRAGHALLIDCRDLSHRPVPLPAGVPRHSGGLGPAHGGHGENRPKPARIVVCDSRKRRGLVESAYNQRRQECEEAVRRLQAVLPGVRALRDVQPEDLQRHQGLLPPIVLRRARHVVEESARVLASVAALEAGDLATFGRLLNESHASLRDLYQVSCPELDALVEVAQAQPGCLGSRLTGAGFGGCTVSLVRTAAVADFTAAVARGYTARTGLTPEVYVCQAADGAGEVS